VGTGAPDLTSVVVKVTNLCPPDGNEAWCSYDVNSYGYDAHFDLMDYNMNGLISSMGWNNPEVVYEEVDCAANGYTDWNCQCASATADESIATTAPTVASAAPTTAPVAPTNAPVAPPTAPVAPTTAPVAPTTAPVAATTAPVAATTAPVVDSVPVGSSGNVQLQMNGGSNNWWVGFSLVNPAVSSVSYVEIKDSSASASWTKLSYQGNAFWNLYSYNPTAQVVLPLSLRITGVSGSVATANNIITSLQAATVDTGVAV